MLLSSTICLINHNQKLISRLLLSSTICSDVISSRYSVGYRVNGCRTYHNLGALCLPSNLETDPCCRNQPGSSQSTKPRTIQTWWCCPAGGHSTFNLSEYCLVLFSDESFTALRGAARTQTSEWSADRPRQRDFRVLNFKGLQTWVEIFWIFSPEFAFWNLENFPKVWKRAVQICYLG